ncbi:PREDICTED: putative B3 domain-containing protein At3g49610 [Tarenaya hassleriana]|uniref:putative B3 domain-containing protein At3g49610 n=1 Tax=Tarenaya hassleriana TaxID=28532 RepID=UPI00053C2BAD|nr:PREDICTED: putative B3 domain-containing protein At3g49610 [Tarenaya hassleriana]
MEIVADDPPAPPAAQSVVREPPAWIADAMTRMNGQDPRLVTEKTVTKSDVNKSLSRLLIPFTAIKDEDFLTDDERRSIDGMYEESKNTKKKYAGFQVKVIDPMTRTWDLALKRWNMEKSSKNDGFSSNYSLQKNWNRLAEANEFEEGDGLELWSFRAEGQLCLAIFTH